MTEKATEVGFVFQCTLCGCYSIFAVDALDPAEVARKATGAAAAAGHVHKTLQRDVHAVELELLEQIQRRAVAETSPEVPAAARGVRYALLPCAPCTEISTGKKYGEWLDDRESLDVEPPCGPHVPVIFEEGELPPAYVQKSGKWCLAQGVGPKDLDLRLPNQLPAQQFRTLLPQAAPPIRPQCWQREGAGEPPEPEEVWYDRRALVEAASDLSVLLPSGGEVGAGQASGGERGADGKRGPERRKGDGKGQGEAVAAPRAPPIGVVLPWLEELRAAGLEAWAGRPDSKGGPRKDRRPAPVDGANARYVPVPLLRVADVILPLAEEKRQAYETAQQEGGA